MKGLGSVIIPNRMHGELTRIAESYDLSMSEVVAMMVETSLGVEAKLRQRRKSMSVIRNAYKALLSEGGDDVD